MDSGQETMSKYIKYTSDILQNKLSYWNACRVETRNTTRKKYNAN